MFPLGCSNCGCLFGFDARLVTPRPNVFMSGCTAQCPQCGEMMPIPDGDYQLVGQIFQLAPTSPQSPEDIRAMLLSIARDWGAGAAQGQMGEAKAASLLESISETNPEWAPILEAAREKRGSAVALGLLAMLLVGVVTQNVENAELWLGQQAYHELAKLITWTWGNV